MKKRTVGLLLTMVLSFSLFGCGNNADQKQEEPQQTETQEDTEKQGDIETENFVFLSEVGDREYLLEDFDWEEISVEFTTQYETNIYNMEGRNIGYIKTDVPVTITEHGINSGWYRFKNPENGTDYEYLCVLRDDAEAQGGQAPQVQDEEIYGIETETMRIYPDNFEYSEDKEVASDISWENCNIEHTTTSTTFIYNNEGKNVGYLKENVTITLTEEDTNGTWYRFKNPESKINSEYLLIEKKTIEYQQGEEERQAQYAEEDRIYNEVMDLFDEDKTYTIEEFYTMMQDAAEKIGVEFSNDVAQSIRPATWTINLEGSKLKETYESLITYMMFGPDGANKMDAYFGLVEQNPDTSGDFDIYVFLRYHQE